jgi:hypothetical protein
MDRLQYRMFTIKNKYLQWAARLTVATAALGFMAVITLWAWAALRPLDYSYPQVFFGWLVIGLAIDRVRIGLKERQKSQVYNHLSYTKTRDSLIW